MANPTSPAALRRLRRSALAAVLLAGTALGGFAVAHVDAAETTTAAPVNPTTTSTAHLPDFADLVAQAKPAVVSITSKLAAEPDEDGTPMPMPFAGPGHKPHGHAVEARGSGFIVDPNGTVVTNNHVVKGAKTVSVQLDDGTELPAKVIGRDARTDLAVVKIEAGKPLPYIQLGDSKAVRPGEWVVAMGNPFGLGGSVTAGIISAEGRDIGAGPYDQFLQIDAPINQGNSGGPLFTQDGKVIGVNTAILSPSGGSIGIGFAIPSNTVKNVVAELEKSGHVTRGYLGVEAQPVAESLSKALRLKGHNGALIAGVQPDSPAAKAGLEPGDVISAVNGETVKDPRDLAVDVANLKPGTEAKIDFLRDGEAQAAQATVTQLPAENQTANAGGTGGEGEHGGQPKLGLALAPISPDMRGELDLPDGTKGAVVAQVQPGSPAEQAGIRPGDVIVGVGGKAVGSPSEAVRAIRSATAKTDAVVALRVIRDGRPAFIAVSPSQGSNDESQQG
ncbi:MAG: trypsin-like peptidase domain-containing protein [Acetobacteraceae bacterium]|nr:trypsin-like peptidase domain-containing protein [Acetobacteraceae bacterium]